MKIVSKFDYFLTEINVKMYFINMFKGIILSLYIYVYTYMCECTHIYAHIYMCVCVNVCTPSR